MRLLLILLVNPFVLLLLLLLVVGLSILFLMQMVILLLKIWVDKFLFLFLIPFLRTFLWISFHRNVLLFVHLRICSIHHGLGSFYKFLIGYNKMFLFVRFHIFWCCVLVVCGRLGMYNNCNPR